MSIELVEIILLSGLLIAFPFMVHSINKVKS